MASPSLELVVHVAWEAETRSRMHPLYLSPGSAADRSTSPQQSTSALVLGCVGGCAGSYWPRPGLAAPGGFPKEPERAPPPPRAPRLAAALRAL